MAKPETDEMIVKKRSFKLIIVLVIIVIIALVASVYFYSKYQEAQKLSQASGQNASNQDANIVAKVGKLIELPNEAPSQIATVKDKTKLPKYPFFANAQNGDKVLFYAQAKEAILYRPSENKLIDVAPFNPVPTNGPTPTGSISPSSSPTPTTKPKNVSLLILNGTTTTGLAGTAATRITSKITAITTVSKGDSVKNYTKTVIVDPNANKQIDDQLISVVGGAVISAMPAGENASKTDITIILGSDFK